MKKVTIVSDFYPPHWTGIAKAISYIAESIATEFSTTILTVQFDKKLAAIEKNQHLTIRRFPVLFSLSRAKFSLSLLVYFLKNIKRTDYVLINSPSIHILAISIISKIFKKKLLIFHQGDLILPKGKLNYVIEKFFNIASLLSFMMAKQLATYTNDYAKHSRLLGKFPQKTQAFIPPLPYFLNQETSRQLDSRLKNKLEKIKNKKMFLIAFAGRFVEEKGFDVLLKAAIKLRQTRKDFCLVFAGETDIVYEKTFVKEGHLITQLKNNLFFLGLLDDKQLQSFYQLIDLFVLPSRSECFGLVQAEAMAQKTPVLVSNIPGARDPVRQSTFGLLFEPNNPDDLAKKIDTMLNGLSGFDQYYNEVLKYFNYQDSQEKLINFFKN
jgi:glycosyltransferase involved in cell wall biosynthesis